MFPRISKPSTKGHHMFKPVIHLQSQLLFRKSTKPNRVIRIRPGDRLNLVFRPINWRGAKLKSKCSLCAAPDT